MGGAYSEPVKVTMRHDFSKTIGGYLRDICTVADSEKTSLSIYMPTGKGNWPIKTEENQAIFRLDLEGMYNFLMFATTALSTKDGCRSDDASRYIEWALIRYDNRALFLILSEKKDIYDSTHTTEERRFRKEPVKVTIPPNPYAIEFVEQFKPFLKHLSIDDLFEGSVEGDYNKLSEMLFKANLCWPQVSYVHPTELPDNVEKRWDVDFTTKNKDIDINVEVVDEKFKLKAVTPIKNVDGLHEFLTLIKEVHSTHGKKSD